MCKCKLSLKVLQIANFSQITHSPTFGRAFTWSSFRAVANYSLKMSKCELSLKVLQIANFSQITHLPTFGRAFTWSSFRPVANYSPAQIE